MAMKIEESATVHLPSRNFKIVAWLEHGQVCQRIFQDDEEGAEEFYDEKYEVPRSCAEIDIY